MSCGFVDDRFLRPRHAWLISPRPQSHAGGDTLCYPGLKRILTIRVRFPRKRWKLKSSSRCSHHGRIVQVPAEEVRVDGRRHQHQLQRWQLSGVDVRARHEVTQERNLVDFVRAPRQVRRAPPFKYRSPCNRLRRIPPYKTSTLSSYDSSYCRL